MLSLMLAAAVHCADPGYCPAAEQLQRAYEAWFQKDLAEKSAAFMSSGQMVMFDALPIRRMTGARGGKPLPATETGPQQICCTATFHTAIHSERQTMILVRGESGWAVQSVAAKRIRN